MGNCSMFVDDIDLASFQVHNLEARERQKHLHIGLQDIAFTKGQAAYRFIHAAHPSVGVQRETLIANVYPLKLQSETINRCSSNCLLHSLVINGIAIRKPSKSSTTQLGEKRFVDCRPARGCVHTLISHSSLL